MFYIMLGLEDVIVKTIEVVTYSWIYNLVKVTLIKISLGMLERGCVGCVG